MRTLFKHGLYLPLAFSIVLFAFPSLANPPSNAAPLEKQELNDVLNNALSVVNQIAADKKNACMRAFGNNVFCTCIAENTPPGFSFDMYIAAVTKTRDELGYDAFTPNDQRLVDSTRQARDKCLGIKSDGAGAAR